LMLASTMQFSRYGRPRDETRRIHGGPSRTRETKPTPVPSGPNSVPSKTPPPPPFRPPQGERTRPASPASQPTSQYSTELPSGTSART
jgi:hypothetical protein